MYDSTKSLLRGILQSMETGDKSRWDDYAESGKACLYEMHQMSRPLYKAYKVELAPKSGGHLPLSERLNRAIPHVKDMVHAIQRKDQATAIESGKAALAEM